jgi:uncharacterized protein with von Willebrand factor type A (vWA) domain
MATIRYTEWDGSQRVRLTAERVLDRLAEYLSYTDDLQQALEWLLRQGIELEGVRIMGTEDLLEKLREKMRRRHEQFNLDYALDGHRRRLEELIDLEREALAGKQDEAALARLARLQALSKRLSESIEQLGEYEFEDAEAEAELERLRVDLDDLGAFEEFQHRFGDLFQGPEALDYERALELMREMERLKQLEEEILSGNLARVDPQALREALGDDAWRSLQGLRQMLALLQEAGYLRDRGGRAELSPKGVRRIGQLALRDIYQGLLRDRSGSHGSDHRGTSEIRPEATKPYVYGDPLHVDVVRTLKKAVARSPRTPLRLDPADFEVFDVRHATTCSTVLLLDMSWSMSWEGRFAAAKKVAMAMESLIRSRFPRDYFGIVGFYTRATELRLRDLPEATWNMGDPFTNLQDGLRLASKLLGRHPSTNQSMIVITDGQPTAYFSGGRLYCEWPLSFGGISMRAAHETLREVERVTRRGVVINTFMLDDSPSLRAFVERMTRINRGRALFSRPDRLGEYLLVDYIARKRRRI